MFSSGGSILSIKRVSVLFVFLTFLVGLEIEFGLSLEFSTLFNLFLLSDKGSLKEGIIYYVTCRLFDDGYEFFDWTVLLL